MFSQGNHKRGKIIELEKNYPYFQRYQLTLIYFRVDLFKEGCGSHLHQSKAINFQLVILNYQTYTINTINTDRSY
jgi:hypothetical protein